MEVFLSVKYAAWKSIPFPSRPSISDFTLAQEIRMYPYLYFQKVKMIETNYKGFSFREHDVNITFDPPLLDIRPPIKKFFPAFASIVTKPTNTPF